LTALLTVRNLSHRYNADVLLSFADVLLSRGALLMVRGPSGSGKSTLLHLLGGVLPITSDAGSVLLDGTDVGSLTSKQRDGLRPFVVGWMPQRHSMIGSVSVLDNVLLPVALARRVTGADRMRASELLRALEIESLAQRRPADISVGQLARVNLARALAAQPKLLLADEPSAALDDASVNAVASVIAVYVSEGGSAIVASHDGRLRDSLLRMLGDRFSERSVAP